MWERSAIDIYYELIIFFSNIQDYPDDEDDTADHDNDGNDLRKTDLLTVL